VVTGEFAGSINLCSPNAQLTFANEGKRREKKGKEGKRREKKGKEGKRREKLTPCETLSFKVKVNCWNSRRVECMMLSLSERVECMMLSLNE